MERSRGRDDAKDTKKIVDSWHTVLTLGLIVLVGINLRTILLAVPPILPLLSRDLHLSYTETGLLTSLPTLVMGAASLPVGILIGRLGGRFMIATGLLLLALGGFLRAAWPAVLPLYFFTAVLSLGSTFSQTAIPALARQWFPRRIGFATALYSDGLVAGETLGAVLTLPILNWLGQDAWAGSFIFWSIPVAITFVLWLWLAPVSSARQVNSAHQSSKFAPATPAPRSALLNPWTLGLLLGGAQLIYFGANGWIASYNQAVHAPAVTWLALGALNAAQLPVTLGATLFADKLVGRRVPFIVCSGVCLAAIIAWVWTPTFLEPLWTAALGGASILIYTLGIALPALLAKQEQVGRWTGTMLTVGYFFSFLGPFIGGWLWDMLHIPAIVFLPLVCAAGIVLLLSLLLPLQETPHK